MKNKKTTLSLLAAACALCPQNALAGAGVALQAAAWTPVGLGFAAALTMGVCVLGSAYAVGRIGAAAMGAAAEKPELLIRSLLFVALAGGLAVMARRPAVED